MTDTPTPETAPLMHAAANESIEAVFRRGCQLERDLEQERQDRKQADLDTIRALGERNAERAELAAERALADRLATQLGDIMDEFEDRDDIDFTLEDQQALAAWKEARRDS